MVKSLPTDPNEFIQWTWLDFEPYYRELQNCTLRQGNLHEWLDGWSQLYARVDELYNRLMVSVSANTADVEAEERYKSFLDDIYPRAMEAENELKRKFIESGLEPAGMEIPLRNMRSEADLFRAENLPLQAMENKVTTEYDKIAGAQSVTWEGQERTIDQMQPILQDPDRDRREKAWRLVAERQLADREDIDRVWGQLLDLRLKIARNAGRKDYRAYRWQDLHRFDYTPDDAIRFQNAIEEVAVPAMLRVYARRKERLGLDTLRPWDLDVDSFGSEPLRPFETVEDLKRGISKIFHQVDPELGAHFDVMINEGLLDLENRKNKAPGGYCTMFMTARRPFIFMNAVGIHDDVQTLLHEGGHAFHVFESAAQPYIHQLNAPTEFAEVASMGMELLASPYLAGQPDSFYSPDEAARARIQNLENSICFWPYMAVVDAFQHWVYENPEAAADPQQCDARWAELWRRFMPGVDWSGFEDVMATGWQRKLHIHIYPFYYIEYGLAQLGAVQVWANALKDQAGAVASYRKGLRLGGTASLPDLFKAAGARFAFDASTLREAVSLMEATVQTLEEKL